jgi:hypothetical protein
MLHLKELHCQEVFLVPDEPASRPTARQNMKSIATRRM